MEAHPSIALVLLNYNGKEYLQKNLPLVKGASYGNKKIYVIDNHSDDDSVSYLQQNHPDVLVIQNEKNFGYAGGYNKGLSHIKAEYYFLLNTDIEVTPNFIEPIISRMENDPTVGICQPKILSISRKNYFEYAGAAGGWIDIFGYTFARGRVFDYYEEDVGQYNDDCNIFWASGACMVIRSSVFKTLNGFYDHFFMYWEEVDLCWRALAGGHRVVYCPDAVIYHQETDKLLYQSPKRLYYLFRNNLIMMHRNLPLSSLAWTLPARLVLNFVALFYFIARGHFRIAGSNVLAHLHYARWIFSNDRREPRAANKTSLHRIGPVYKGSLIYQYYLLKKKKFSDIIRLKN